MVIYRSLSVYFFGRPRAKIGVGAKAGVGVGVQETTSVLFALVKAPTSLFLPLKEGLQQVCGLAILLARWISFGSDYKLLFFQTGWLTY